MTHKPDQEWWSAAEIAEARLPDMPTTTQRVTANAVRLGWRADAERARRRAGKGGGWEYHWALLPSRARNHLIAQVAPAAALTGTAAGPDRAAAWAQFDALPQVAKDKAETRLATLQKVEALEAGGETRVMAVHYVSKMQRVSERTIFNWLGMVEGVRSDDRLPYLTPRHQRGARPRQATVIHPDFADRIRADYLRPEAPSLTSVYDRVVRVAEAQDIPVVPLHTVRRWVDRTISMPVQIMARKGYDAFKRTYPHQVRDKSAMHAMEGVNGDFHRFDVFVRFPATVDGRKEEVIRPQMCSFQDIHSGKIVAWLLDRSANSHAVQSCIGKMIEDWGIPKHVLLDNGREFTAKSITGQSKTRFRFKVKEDDLPGLLTNLGCEIHWALPYSGQSKPIERAFRDLCDRVAKHPAFAGAYTGNRPDAKPENYGARAIPLHLFEEVLREEIQLHNARPERRSEVAFGRSFDEVFDESYATAPIRKATPEQRRLWLTGAEGIRANRFDGSVRFMGNGYWADWMHSIMGQKIVARFDRDNLWDGIHIYTLANEYLGFAACREKVGFFSAADARTHRRNLKAHEKAAKAELDAFRTLTTTQLAEETAALPKAAPEPVEARVISGVFDGPTKRSEPNADPAIAVAQAKIISMARTPSPETEPDAAQLYARALELEAVLRGGGNLTKDQKDWLAGYQKTPDYRGQKMMVEAFARDRNRK